jgi:homoserine kinase
MNISVFAPASIANMSVGFDVLGLPVTPIDGSLLGDVVSIAAANEDSLLVVGPFADKLPKQASDNIAWQCLLLFAKAMQEKGLPRQQVKLTLDKKMPVGSGLGSSACSVVASLAALNAFYQDCFDQTSLLRMMGQMEAKISGSLHYDNVAPCYLGGLQLMVADPNVISRTLPGFDDCYYVMAYPGIEVSTKAARDILPEQYSRQDVIAYGQNLATFVDASYRQDKSQAFSVLQDVVAEPYRQHLLPGFTQAKSHLMQQGALAVGISGSGPTLFCICDKLDLAQQLALWLEQHYLQTESGFVHVCRLDQQGARQLPHPEKT